MKAADTERRIRALAAVAELPHEFDPWPGVQKLIPRARRRRAVVRSVMATAAVLAIAVVVTLPLALEAPPSALAVVRHAAAVARTGAGLSSFELTEVTRTAAVGFQPEPPPPLITEHIEYADPSHWRAEFVITKPLHEGTQEFTEIRNGPVIATIAAGQVTIARAGGTSDVPFAGPGAWQQAAVHKLLAAGSTGRCTPTMSLDDNGQRIDRRPTVVLHLGPSPCPSADVPQANGPATFWLDKQTFLVLRAVLRGPGTRLAETSMVNHLRYHVAFPAGAFDLPSPSRARPACPTSSPLPDVSALRSALAYSPLIPASLPEGWRIGAIAPGGVATGRCKISVFTITYRNAADRPAVQLYEAPQASPSVRFPGTLVTIRPGLTGTLNSSTAMAILWWIQDGRYCSLQSGGLTAGVPLTRTPAAVLLHIAASMRN